MKLWGGPSDSGCCSVADVEDARRVCYQLGVDHHVFNFTSEFERDVVAPYVAAHGEARTPNPCIACNAHLKFDRFLQRAGQLGFDAIATGHHARLTATGGRWELRRGSDEAKDQSYVLYMLGQAELARLCLPIGDLTKSQVRELAATHGLRTATKPDSQDVCFISRVEGRESFLSRRIPVGEGRLVARDGEELGTVDALELVTVGQRRGLGLLTPSPPERRYVLDVDLATRTATVGALGDLLVDRVEVEQLSWCGSAAAHGTLVQAQFSAHGRPVPAHWDGDDRAGAVVTALPVRRVAPGQAVVMYRRDEDGDVVLGGGTAR
jgi:tRNA-specific 2-thiouridylase